ncbi:MAG: family, FAD-dependent NAD(P)-disulfide oxidoreductase [Edaphobacter sp.]|nr:family, FAD-dependent NAD(P)-disulfide oxidoreductase [Edaphobacter sp.]
MPETTHYDAIIIGSGQGGNPLAVALSERGKRTAMIERAAVGGTCVNYGCTPTKTMIASAEVAYLARRAKDYGVRIGELSVDMPAVRERKRNMVNTWREGSERRLKEATLVELIRGEGSFTGPKQVRVQLSGGGERSLSADIIVINTGLSVSTPLLKGLESVPWLDNVSVMELDVVPEHLLVLGGGYIGLEFAQMFRRFGSRVTVIQRGKQLLPTEDADIADEIAKILREDGVEILLEAEAESVASSDKTVLLTVSQDGERKAVEGTHLLIATGRHPNTEMLNLAAAGIAMDEHGYVSVNDRLETNVDGVYALGDVKGGPAFTHVSYDDYRILKANLLDGGDGTIAGRVFPSCVFIDPQLGRIGLSEREAAKLGKKVRIAKLPMTSVARAMETSRSRGFMKALVDPETEQILGAAVLGEGGGEIMSMIQIAMMGKLKYTVLRDADLAHPTLAESLNNLFSNFQSD